MSGDVIDHLLVCAYSRPGKDETKRKTKHVRLKDILSLRYGLRGDDLKWTNG